VNRHLHAVIYCRAVEQGAHTAVTILNRGPAGAGLARPAVAELLSLVRSGNVDPAVVDSPDRLTHSIAELRALTQ
jgi:DNA invertase Pin-like site-specific DNA recombinase